jgi:hypothetical protein
MIIKGDPNTRVNFINPLAGMHLAPTLEEIKGVW